jgi:hypothetical protein
MAIVISLAMSLVETIVRLGFTSSRVPARLTAVAVAVAVAVVVAVAVAVVVAVPAAALVSPHANGL